MRSVFCWLVVCVTSGAVLTSCERKTSEQGGLPVADSWQAPAAGKPVGNGDVPNPHAGMANDPHAGLAGNPHGGADPHAGLGGNPHGGADPHAGVDMEGGGNELPNLPPPDPNRPIDKSKFLRGKIRVAPAMASSIKKGSVIYLHARPVDPLSGDMIGGPVAVDRIDVDRLPVEFNLDETKAMSAGTGFAGDVIVIARFDQDEDAMTKDKGDIEGRIRAKVPAEKLVLTLDKKL